MVEVQALPDLALSAVEPVPFLIDPELVRTQVTSKDPPLHLVRRDLSLCSVNGPVSRCKFLIIPVIKMSEIVGLILWRAAASQVLVLPSRHVA